MSFSIKCFTADADDKIVAVDWQYSNADGTLSNTHVLATPAGDFALANVTQTVLVGWLEDQLQNTAAEFDAAIANAKAQAEYRAGFKKYEIEADETYAVADQNAGGAQAAAY